MRLILAALALAIALAPLAASAPATCADPCVVEPKLQLTYLPPAVVVASGGSVVWHHTDGYGHVEQDGKNGADSDRCFFALAPAGESTNPVRFDLVDGTLLATSPEFGTLPCGNAVMTPTGAVLPYYCALHTNMRGTILVTEG